MEGKEDPPELRGIIPNSFNHIFDHISIAEDRQVRGEERRLCFAHMCTSESPKALVTSFPCPVPLYRLRYFAMCFLFYPPVAVEHHPLNITHFATSTSYQN
jgi:hypothetical protein